MTSWDTLLARLAEAPRENGSPAIAQTATFLADTLRGAGLPTELVTYTAHPYRLRIAGVLALLAGLLYWRLLRAGRRGAALAVAVLLPAVMLVELDWYVPLVGWPGAVEQQHVVARLPAVEPTRRLIFTAHFDTKTDLLDHVERAPIALLGLPAVALMIAGALGARRWRRLGTVAGVTAAVYGVGLFLTLSAGALVPSRSAGAVDDGAACAVLVRLMQGLLADPPVQTDVEVVLLSGEEIGVQGSWEYARERFTTPPDLPTMVVNLDPIGTSSDLAILGSETFTAGAHPPDPDLVALLQRVYHAQRGTALPVTWYGGGTDARSFLAHGVPAATLISTEPGSVFVRHLHSAADDRARLDEPALDATVSYLDALVRAADAKAPGTS